MSNEAPLTPSPSTSTTLELGVGSGDEDELLYGGGWGWVEARTRCVHMDSLSADLAHIPTPDTHCSRFMNKHMVEHHQETSHSLALSFSDLLVWCYACDAYLDAQVTAQLLPAYETAYLLKFGQARPCRAVHSPGFIRSSSSS